MTRIRVSGMLWCRSMPSSLLNEKVQERHAMDHSSHAT